MRCKTCDYPLWNLPGRACPECGSAFKPSDFEFVPNAVRFCCPHCSQPYYGTDAQGRLFPRAFACVACGRDVDMDQMVLLPTADVSEAQTQVDENPWLVRRRVGLFRAWFAMIGRAMTAPGRLIKATPDAAGLGPALGYAALTVLVFGVASLAGVVFLPLMMLSGFSPGAGAAGVIGAVVGGVLATPVLLAVFIALWGLTAHGLLHATGGSRAGIERTFEAICYSTGAAAMAAIPCVGQYTFVIGLVWWMVSATVMVREGQSVPGWRASLAVLTLPGLVIVGSIAAVVVTIAMTISGAGGFGGPGFAATMPSPASVSAQTLSSWLLMHTYSANGQFPSDAARLGEQPGPRRYSDGVRYPAHAAELLVGNTPLPPTTFVTSDTLSKPANVPIGSTTLDKFAALTPAQQKGAAIAAAASLPPGVVAHRLGDFVFTYHGIKPDADGQPDPRLWVLITSPDPDQNASSLVVPIEVGLADGTTKSIAAGSFPAELAAQNRVRATLGLPPLPDPAMVTHEEPWSAGVELEAEVE